MNARPISRTIGSHGPNDSCVVCGRQACSHGDFTIARRNGEEEDIEVLLPVCPACLYGDVDAIDRAEKRVLFNLGLYSILPTRLESM